MFHTKFLSSKKYILVCGILILTQLSAFSQQIFPFVKGKFKHRISVSVLQSFFYNDKRLTTSTKTKPGFDIAYKAEYLTGHHLNFIIGLDYSFQHFSFKGYYDAPGYTYLFDKSFPYFHEIKFQEINLPIGFKESIQDEKFANHFGYVCGGMSFRYLVKTSTFISNDSTGFTIYEGKQMNMDFESRIPTPKINSCLYLGCGFQRNNRDSGQSLFVEISYKYGVSRFMYHGFNNSNNLGIRNNYLALTVGFRI